MRSPDPVFGSIAESVAYGAGIEATAVPAESRKLIAPLDSSVGVSLPVSIESENDGLAGAWPRMK